MDQLNTVLLKQKITAAVDKNLVGNIVCINSVGVKRACCSLIINTVPFIVFMKEVSMIRLYLRLPENTMNRKIILVTLMVFTTMLVNARIRSNSSTSLALHLKNAHRCFLESKADSGYFYTTKALWLARSMQIDSSIAFCNYFYGRYYYEKAQYKKCIAYSKKALQWMEKHNRHSTACRAMIRISDSYIRLGKYNEALNFAYKAQGISKKIGDTTTYINSCLSAFELSLYLEQNDKAYTILENALAYLGNSKLYNLHFTLHSSFCYFFDEVQGDSCLRHAKLTVKYARLTNNPHALLESEFMLGNAYMQKKDYAKAEEHFLKVIYETDDEREPTLYNNTKFSLAGIYHYKGDFRKSNACFNEVLAFYKKNAMVKEILDVHWWLSKNEEARGNYQKAFEYFKIYSTGHDSLVTNEKIQRLNEKHVAQQLREKEIQLKLKQESDIKVQKALYKQKQQYTIIGFMLVIIILAILFFVLYSRYRFNKERSEQQLLLKLKDAEITGLQTQMNPHFIFNSLNSVLDFIQKSKNEEAGNFIVKFSRLIRNVLENSSKRHIGLDEEIAFIKLYIELEGIRFGKNFDFHLKVDPGIEIPNTVVPPMILQPYIENAILHGIQNKQKLMDEQKMEFRGLLLVEFKKSDKEIICEIKDNGVGLTKAAEIKKNKLYAHKSMGMQITKNRLELMTSRVLAIKTREVFNDKEVQGVHTSIILPLTEIF